MGGLTSSSVSSSTSESDKDQFKQVDIFYKPTLQEQSLMDACELGRLEKVLEIANCKGRKLDAECENAKGSTPLKIACREGYPEITAILLDQFGSKINIHGGMKNGGEAFYGGPLYQACKMGNVQCASTLITYAKCDINLLTDKFEISSLMVSVRRAQYEIVELLVRISKPDCLPWSQYCRSDYQYLSDYFDDYRMRCKEDKSEEEEKKEKEIILINEDDDCDHNMTDSKNKEESSGMMIKQRMLSARQSLNQIQFRMPSSMTLFVSEKESKYSSVVVDGNISSYPSRELSLLQADSAQGLCAMHSAGWHNHNGDIMRQLLLNGASPDQSALGKNSAGHTHDRPLHRTLTGWSVSSEKRVEKVETLLAYGADPMATNSHGVMPWHRANKPHIPPSVRKALKYGMQHYTEDKPYLHCF